MAQQKFHNLDEEPEGRANVSSPLLLRKGPTHKRIAGRLLLPPLPISTQGTFSSMVLISGCSGSVPQLQLALGVS